MAEKNRVPQIFFLLFKVAVVLILFQNPIYRLSGEKGSQPAQFLSSKLGYYPISSPHFHFGGRIFPGLPLMNDDENLRPVRGIRPAQI